MPNILLPVPNVDISVSRPTNISIIHQLMDNTGIPKNTPILYMGDIERAPQLGSTLTDTEEEFKFTGRDKITIEVTEEPVNSGILSTSVYRPENIPIYWDKALDAYMRPVYSNTLVTINVKFKSTDRVKARRWRDDIRTRISMSRDVFLHVISYSYQVPMEFIVILQEIHRLRENQAGYDEDFNTYLSKYFIDRATVETDQSGNNRMLSIAETQQRVQGYFDFEEGPEIGSRDDDTSTWTINFTYKFTYNQPLECTMYYPLMIHNQFLDARYRYTKKPYELGSATQSFSLSTLMFNNFEAKKVYETMSSVSGISIPEIDEFIPANVVHKTMRIYTALVGISDGNRTDLMNLIDVGDYKFTDVIVNFLKGELPYLTTPYQSIFNVSLYEGFNLVDPKKIAIDSSFNVSTISELDLRKVYHLRMSIVTDLSLLSDAAKDRLRNSGNTLITILLGIDPKLVKDINKVLWNQDGSVKSIGENNNLHLPIVIGNTLIPKKGFNDVILILNGDVDKRMFTFNTVMKFFIEAHRNQC